MKIGFFFTLLALFSFFLAPAQKRKIVGSIYDQQTKDSLVGAIIYNIHTGEISTSDSLGNFELEMNNEELIEFQMLGYKTARLRLQSYITARYYSIGLVKDLPPVEFRRDSSFEADSTYWARFYAKELGAHKLRPYEIVAAPWEAASKTYRDKMHFQQSFREYIAMRYVDEYFNKEFIQKHTDLRGNELENFMLFYRPSYEFARSMSKYEFMLWVKNTAQRYYDKQRYEQIQHE